MSPEQWERVKEVFDAAVDLPPGEQAGVLDALSANDPSVRAEAERLLSEYARAGEFAPVVEHPSHSLRPGESVNERYEIVRLVGRGGMGEVYEAHDPMLNESVALKTLQPEFARDAAMLARFHKEILAARRVTHPNVCRVFEVGVHRGLHYFTMELLPGETLAARIRREGGLHAAEAIPLIRQMAEGLHAAHQAGVIHRDFKSGNVMLTGERAVIMDFGLARAERGVVSAAAAAGAGVSENTSATLGQMAGTVGYMSIEQLTGKTITAASDIYSFGIVLYEMAAGKLPFDGKHLINSAVQRVSGQIPSIRGEAPEIDPRWESAVQRCLQPEPDKRFPSAAAIASHFADGPRRMAWKMPAVSRRVWGSAVAAAVVAVLAALTFWPGARVYVPKQEALTWYEKGVESFLAMTYESARKKLEKAVSLDPGYAPARAYLAAALAEVDQQSAAKEEMLKALSAAQRSRLSVDDTARVQALQHVISREFESAKPPLEQFAVSAPGNREKAAAHVHLAWLATKRQNIADTLKHLQQASRLNPSSAAAKVRLATVLGQQQKINEAVAVFGEAEALFRAASDTDGALETIWQQSRVLARGNRTAEALKLIEKALPIAASTGNRFYEIRLWLAQALAYRNSGELAKSQEVAERAVRAATESKQDAIAAVGLIDLGNAYLQGGKPVLAERYFEEGLRAARSGHADFSEARAGLSLGSLHVQYNRSAQAMPFIERALPFFRDGGYRRETMQALLLQGAGHTRLGRYGEAERILGEALQLGEQLRDREQLGLARSYMSAVMDQTGRIPEAVIEVTKAVELFGDLRGGYRAAFSLSHRARLWCQLGQFDRARADIAESTKWAAKMQGNQAQVKAKLALIESEITYLNGQWQESARWARVAGALHGDDDEDRLAALLTGLCAARRGGGSADARAAIAALDQAGSPYLAANGRLWLAEAAAAPAEAAAALRFFEPLRNWEAIWRCRRALGGGVEHGPAQQAAVEELRRNWPAESQATYFARPDFRKFKL